MADGTVKIDLLFPANKQKFHSDTELVNDLLKRIGEGTGQHMDDEFDKNTKKMADQSRSTSKQIKDDFKDPVKQKIEGDDKGLDSKVKSSKLKLKDFPKETKTKLIAEAQKAGIDNFGKLLKHLPKKQQTELLAKAEKGEVIDFEELIKKVPKKYQTEMKLNDNASPALKSIQNEAQATSDKFSHLKEIIAGSFIGNALSGAFSAVTSGLQSLASEAIQSSDAIFKFKSTMKFGGFGEDEIKSATKEVKKYADDTVYELNDVSNTTAQLAANGIKDYMGLTEAAGNLNAAAGGNADTFKSVAMMLTQTAGAGKLTTENWNQLTDAIPGASGKLQEAMKKNKAFTGNFRDAMADGQITADEFSKAIMQLGQEDGAVKAAKSTKTFEGAVGNAEAGIVSSMKDIVDAFGKDKLTNAIGTFGDVISSSLGGIVTIIDKVKSKSVILGTIASDFGEIAKIFGSEAWKTAKEMFNGITNAIGKLVDKSSVAKDPLSALNNILKEVAKHKGAIQTVADTVVGLFTAFAAYKAVQGAKKAFDSVVKSISAVKNAFSLLGTAIALHPFAALALAIVAIGVAFVALYKHNKKFRDFVNGLVESAKDAWDGTVKWFKKIGKAIKDIFTSLIDWFKKDWKEIALFIVNPIYGTVALLYKHNKKFRDWANSVIESVKDAFKGIGEWFSNVWGSVSDGASNAGKGITSAFDDVKEWFSKLWKSISKGAKAGWEAIKTAIAFGAKAVKVVALAPIVVIAALIVSVWNKIKKPTTAFWNWMKDHILAVTNALKKAAIKNFDFIKDKITTVWNAIKKVTTAVWGWYEKYIVRTVQAVDRKIVEVLVNMWHKITSIWDSIQKTTKRVWNPIKNFIINTAKEIYSKLTSWFNKLRKAVVNIWNTIKKFTSSVWNQIKNFLVNIATSIWRGIVNKFNALKNSITGIWNSVSKVTHNVWNAVTSWVVNKAHSLWKGVTGKFDALKNSISSILSSISKGWHNTWNGMSDFFGNIWNSIKKTAKGGINGVIGWLNGGIGGINSVIHTFGGSKNAIGKIKKLATGGSGYRGIAMVNDGGGEEAIIKGGHAYKVTGKNAYVSLEGDETIVPHGPSRAMFGSSIARYAKGSDNWFSSLTGWFKDKWDGIVSFIKHPIKSLENITSKAMGKVSGSELVTKVTPALNTGFVRGIWKKFKDMLSDLKTAHDDEGGSFDGKMGAHGVYGYLWKIASQAMKKFGMKFTSGYRPGDAYYHGKHQAVDIAFDSSKNGSKSYFAPANWVFDHFKKQIGYVITQGKIKTRGKFNHLGSNPNGWSTWMDHDHYDHLHLNGMWGPGDIGSSGGGKVTGSHSNWLKQAGFRAAEIAAANWIVSRESGWNPKATNSGSGAYGLPQSLPGSKMASAGSDWRTNPLTQLKWMKSYIRERYGTANAAKAFWQSHNWYENGGFSNHEQLAHISEGNKLEGITPLSAEKSDRGYMMLGKQAAYMAVRDGLQGNDGLNVASLEKAIQNGMKKVDGNVSVNIVLDGQTIGHAAYPTIQAMETHEMTVLGGNGSTPIIGGAF